VTVIDLASRQVLSEIQTPGCWSIFPSSVDHARFSTLCGDGTVLTIGLDEKGAAISQVRSKKFFDPDADALFIHGEKVGDSYYFISFNGVLHQVNLDGETPVVIGNWSLATGAGTSPGWRPGGYGPLAINPANGLIYLAMHPHGKEGSHKEGAKEIWQFDLATKKLLRRGRANQEISIAASHSGPAQLIGVDAASAALHTYDGVSLKLKKSMKPLGDMPVEVEMQ
jgi:methylamine dehydrogenase heavy chain